MIHIEFTARDIDALHRERFHHPHPRVQLKMEAVYLKSQGLLHHDICRLARISENTLRAYLRQYQEGGIERLKRTDWDGPESDLSDHRRAIEEHFRKNPPRSTSQAAADIERLTGVRRGPTQVREFLKRLGLKFRELGMIPAKADAAEQARFLDEKLRPRLKQARRLKRVVCFVDAAHFVHGTFLGYPWCFTRLLIRNRPVNRVFPSAGLGAKLSSSIHPREGQRWRSMAVATSTGPMWSPSGGTAASRRKSSASVEGSPTAP